MPAMLLSTRAYADAAVATPISQVQGSGATSSYVGKRTTVEGVVTGVQRTGSNAGFFMQDAGDGDAATSDGIFVRIGDQVPGWAASVRVGALATATGTINERGGMTSVDVTAKSNLKVRTSPPGVAAIEAEVLDVPTDPGARVEYLEAHEGMLLTMADALVVGPTNPYGQYVAVDAAKHGARRMGSVPDTTGFVHVNGRIGPKPQLMVGDRVLGMRGPLGVTNGKFEVLPVGNYKALERGPQAPKAFGDIDGDDRFSAADRAAIESRFGQAAAGPLDPADLNGDGKVSKADLNRFDARAARETGAPYVRIASLNTWNFFDSTDAPPPIDDDVPSGNEYRTKLAKLAGSIRDRFGAPELMALQEVENPQVIDDLLARPELRGLGYHAVLLPTTGRRSINPALLVRGEGIEVLGAHQLQQGSDPNEEAIWSAETAGTTGPLFSREPLVVDLQLPSADGTGERLSVIVNHLVSKFSPHGVPTDPVRVAQTTFLRRTVEAMRAADPSREVVVLGDMNDTQDSKALKALTGPSTKPTLVNATATLVPEGERYSYVYEGRSELIDHIAVTPGLVDRIERAGIRHGNADLPVGETWDSSPARASDHDSPYIWLRTGAAPASDAARGATLTSTPRS